MDSVPVPAYLDDDDTFDLERWRTRFWRAVHSYEAFYQSDVADRQNFGTALAPNDEGIFLTDLHIAETCIKQLLTLAVWRGPRVVGMIAEAPAWGWLRSTSLVRVRGEGLDPGQERTALRHDIAERLDAVIPSETAARNEPRTESPSDDLRRASDIIHHAYGVAGEAARDILGPYRGLEEVVAAVERLAGRRLRQRGPSTPAIHVASRTPAADDIRCEPARKAVRPLRNDPAEDVVRATMREIRKRGSSNPTQLELVRELRAQGYPKIGGDRTLRNVLRRLGLSWDAIKDE